MGLGKKIFGLIRSVVSRVSSTSIVQVARPTTPSIEERDFHHHNAIAEGARREEEERRRQEEEEYKHYQEELARRTPPKPGKTWQAHRDFLRNGGVLEQSEDGTCTFGCGAAVPADGGSVDLNDGNGVFPCCVRGVEAVRIVARDWKGTEYSRPRFYYSEQIRLRMMKEEEAHLQRIIKQEEERAAAREEQRQQEALEEKRLNRMEKMIVERCFEHHAIGTPRAGSCEMPGCDEKFAPCRLYFAEKIIWPDTGAAPVGRVHKLCQRHGHRARDIQQAKRAGIFWIFRDEQFATEYFKNRPIRFDVRPTNGHGNGHNGSAMPTYDQLARVERSKKGKPKTSAPQKKKGKLSGLLSTEWHGKADVDRANALMKGAPPPPQPKADKKAKKGKKASKANGAAQPSA